jgi:hypothetical protein
MRRERLETMTGGWFVGDFSPVAMRSAAVEVAVKRYSAGAFEPLHHHKIATEVTVIVDGRAEIAGQTFGAGDILVLEPGEAVEFRAVSDVTTVVVKLPSVVGDKYPGCA